MLLIDAGNSVVKCRVIEGSGETDYRFIIDAHSSNGLDQLKSFLQSLHFREVFVASVAADVVTRNVMRAISEVKPVATIQRLYSLPELGRVKNAYKDFTRLGVDRWLTLLAAEPLNQDVIIVDAGSAITIDLLSHRDSHLGGAIVAGVKTSEQRFKEIFSHIDFAHADIRQINQPGRSTEQCIHLTRETDVVSYTVELIRRWSSLLEDPVKILLCGHDAKEISPHLIIENQIVPDLVFQGMLNQIELQG